MNDKIDPKLIKRLDNLWLSATRALRARDHVTAVDSLKLILRIDRRNATVHNRLGIVYARTKHYKQSLYHFKKANKYEETDSSHHNLGLLYYEIGKYQPAKHHIETALKLESASLSQRHIALAKVFEKLQDYTNVLKQLNYAMRLEPNQQTQLAYLDAYSRYGTNNRLSKELLEALRRSKVEWSYVILDDYPLLLDALRSSHQALENLVYARTNSRMSQRSENARTLAIAYLHNLGANTFLLNKNYSLASANIARSMFEIYLKIGYGLNQKSNRGFAELEKGTLTSKQNANTRLIKRIPITDPQYQQKISINKKITYTLRSLDRRYVKLKQSPSQREIALILDNGVPAENYRLYEQLYEKGSDIIHAENSSISRSALLSGTRQAGLFIDSYALLKILRNLTQSLGDQYITLPELTRTSTQKYQKETREIKESMSKEFSIPKRRVM